MKKSTNSGCVPTCLILLLVITWLIGTLLFWLLNSFASIGATFLLIGDYLANPFTAIGIKSPTLGWLLLGCLLGSILGLIQGLKRTGRYSDLYIVYLAAAAIFLGLQTVAHWKWESQFNLNAFQKVVLQEDFTAAKDWNLTEGAVIKDGGLFQRQPNLNWTGWSSWEGHTFADVDVSADAIKVNGSDDNYFGILARVSDDENQNFYTLRINGNGRYVISKHEKEKWQDIFGPQQSDIINLGNSQNRLRLICQGNLITALINGKLVGIVRDTSYKSGRIAVESERGEESAVAVYFDNILVKVKSQSSRFSQS
ncbi:MAG TPA: hypothetical protein V6D11_13800 [Waterburya sp.]|jgi:hypothetical protein